MKASHRRTGNRVGLWQERVSYEGIRDAGGTEDTDPPQRESDAGNASGTGNGEERHMKVTVWSENGKPVNLRKKPDKAAALADRIPAGTEAELLESLPGWSRIRVKGKTGWMMTEFLSADESAAPGILYTVSIPHRTEAEADMLLRAYTGAVRIEERG